MHYYTEVKINTESSGKRELLIAELSGLGFEGFEEEEQALLAFIPQASFDEPALESIMLRHQVPYSIAAIEEKNWNELWETSFEPVQVGSFCSIRADFHPPQTGTKHEIIITPKMSFGTGHHATTYLMIENMQEMDLTGKAVLDFGTGTGVLAILAQMMGARAVDAIDIDEWSIANAKENFAGNGRQQIRLHMAGTIQLPVMFDVILANINKNVILQSLPAIRNHLLPGGRVLFSGLLLPDWEEVVYAAAAAGFTCTGTKERSNWISIACTTGQY